MIIFSQKFDILTSLRLNHDVGLIPEGGGGALKEQMYEEIKQIKKLKDAEMLMEHYRSIKDKTNANRNRPRSAACVPFHWADAKKC